jgi:hypothetical protein
MCSIMSEKPGPDVTVKAFAPPQTAPCSVIDAASSSIGFCRFRPGDFCSVNRQVGAVHAAQGRSRCNFPDAPHGVISLRIEGGRERQHVVAENSTQKHKLCSAPRRLRRVLLALEPPEAQSLQSVQRRQRLGVERVMEWCEITECGEERHEVMLNTEAAEVLAAPVLSILRKSKPATEPVS